MKTRWYFMAIALLGGFRAIGSTAETPPAETPTVVPENEFSQKATWEQPKAADVRKQVMQWLDEQKPDQAIRSKLEALWPAPEANAPAEPAGVEILDLVAQSLARVDPRAQSLVEQCANPRIQTIVAEVDWLADEKTPAFMRNNLRLLYGRWLAQHELYDEALVQLTGLDVKDVVDPASLLFYHGVANHWLLNKDEGLKLLARLLERRSELPRRFVSMADLLTADLEALDDESLDHISRRMEDIKRRLDLARVGKTVRGIEDGVIASLDKLIEEAEQQQQQRMAQAQARGQQRGGRQQQGRQPGNPRGIQSDRPADESRIAEGKGAGQVTKRPIGNKSGWGDLPPKEREEALQQIGKDFPPHYREAIEQYFRRLAAEGSEK